LSFSSEQSYRTKQSASRIDKIMPIKGYQKRSYLQRTNKLFYGF